MTLDMRQKLKNLAFLGMSVSVLTCTEIPIELKDPIIPESDRIVLIEELTGASCPNCPKGSAAIENILTKFPGKVVAVGIHGDFLAKPTAKSKYDFRNPKAKDLENWFKPWFGKPSASINRVPDETNTLMIDLPDLWQAAVETELQKEHKLNLLMDVKYDMASRRVDIEIAAIPLTDLPGNYAISVYLLETGIVDAQSNGSVILEDFKHKHVLRDMLTRFDGDAFGNNLTAGSIFKRNYSYTLPETPAGLWLPERMEVVAMVSHNESNDKSVLQAVEKSVVE
jgi:hypothetical protein